MEVLFSNGGCLLVNFRASNIIAGAPFPRSGHIAAAEEQWGPVCVALTLGY